MFCQSVVINQGLVRFVSRDGDHEMRTDQIIERVRAGGEAWFGGTDWNGKRVMRISVCNWRTTGEVVARALSSIRTALADCYDGKGAWCCRVLLHRATQICHRGG